MTTNKPDPFYRNHKIRDAISRAIYDSMKVDPTIHLFGEGAYWKVHYDAPLIEKDFLERVHTLPICEDGNVNFAVGASLLGVKPVVDIITADFMFRAMDSICNTAAKLNFVAYDQDQPKTIVIRAEFLIGGPTTGQRLEALFTHIPGLNVALPSNPLDAYGLMRTALSQPGVTIFFEDRMIRDDLIWASDYDLGNSYPPIPFGEAWVDLTSQLRKALTVVTYGLGVQLVRSAFQELPSDSIELIDLRTLFPIDWESVLASVEESGVLLIVETDVRYAGIGAEIAATVIEKIPFATIRRLGGPRETIPANRALHAQTMPTVEQIKQAIQALL